MYQLGPAETHYVVDLFASWPELFQTVHHHSYMNS